MPIKYILACFLFSLIALSTSCDDNNLKSLSFESTGLLAHSTETAEEILLRAHTLDPDAIALVVAGYAFNIGGFPEHPGIAQAWAAVATRAGKKIEDTAYLAAMSNYRDSSSQSDAALLAECELGLTSKYAEIFRDQFDIKARYELLLKTAGPGASQESGYAERRNQLLDKAEQARQTELLVITLMQRPVDEDELELLRICLNRDWVVVLYFVATANNSADKAHRWNLSNLIKFYEMRYRDPVQGESIVEKPAPLWTCLGMSFIDDNKSVLDLIRRAHDGDKAARRAMAQSYGLPLSINFLPDANLFSAWMFENIEDEDGKALLQMAIYSYQQGDVNLAWLMASNAYPNLTGQDRAFSQALLEILEANEQFDPIEANHLNKIVKTFAPDDSIQ